MTYKYLIIGNSAGGIGAAEAIRRVDSDGSLAIISEESYPAYSRPMIPHHLAGETSFNDMLYRPNDFYSDKIINTILGKKVVELHPNVNKTVLEDGGAVTYEKLLIATGGNPLIPKIRGLNKKGIYTFTTMNDAVEIRRRIEQQKTKEAVVLGGGLIGLLAAEALVARDFSVTVVELMQRILGPVLDPTASSMVIRRAEHNGVKAITGHTISEILGDDEVCGVILDDGRTLQCDLLIIAVGVTPRIDLAIKSGLKTNRGIVVNKRMETSVPNVYACGDCAEPYDFAYDRFRLNPIWPAAYVSGMVAGYNMANFPREYDWGTGMNSMNIFGFPVVSIGKFDVTDEEGYEILSQVCEGRNAYRKLVLAHDRIVGVILVNEIDRAGIIMDLMRRKVDVSSFKEALLQENLGLIHLPKMLRNTILKVN